MDNKDFKMKDVEVFNLKKGEIVKAKVIKVTDNELSLDLNYMTEGTMYLDAYSLNKLNSFKDVVKVGDTIEAVIQKISERDDSTLILLSRIPLLKKEALNNIKEKFNNNETINVLINKIVNKGVMGNYLGYNVFIHESQLNFDPENKPANKENFINKELTVKITKLEHNNGNLVIDASRRVIEKEEFFDLKKKEKEERNLKYQTELDNIKVNDILEGTIEKIEKFGIIVKFDLVKGLLKLSQLDHKHILNVSELFKVGDKINVKVIAKNNNKIDLSRKALLKTPHEVYKDNHKIGEKVTGTVIQKFPFGTILELEDGITALLHKNEYSWNPNDNFQNNVKIGSLVDVAILNIDTKNEKISVSKKALEDNPWQRVTLKQGDKTTCKVTNIIPGKALVVEASGVEGHILINDIAIEKVAKIEALYSVGDLVDALVVEVNKEEWVLRLSIKKLLEKNQQEEFEKYILNQEKENEQKQVTIGDRFKDILNK